MKKYLRKIFLGPFTGYRKFFFPKLDDRGVSMDIEVPEADRKLIRVASWFWIFMIILAVITQFWIPREDRGILHSIFFFMALFGNLGASLHLNNMNKA